MIAGLVNYTDYPGLQDAIHAAGYSIIEQGGNPTNIWFASDAAAVQAIIDGYPTSTAYLNYLKGAKLQALQELYAGKIDAGFAYTVPGDATGAHTYQIDELPSDTRQSSLASISDAVQQAQQAKTDGVAGTPWDPNAETPFEFYDAANVGVAMTYQQVIDFGKAVGMYVTLLKLRALKLKNLIIAAATMADLDAIDITTGWSSNG